MPTIAGEKSVEITRPRSPTAAAASRPVSPAPAASSSTTSPGRGASSRMSHSRTGATAVSMRARCRAQPGAIASATSYTVRRYSAADVIGLQLMSRG